MNRHKTGKDKDVNTTNAPRIKLLKIETELNQEVLERETLIRGALLALLAKQHLMIIGPPGTGKSYLTEKIASRISNSRFFGYLLTRYSTPDEIWGPVDIRAYTDQGVHRRITKGKLAESEITFLDEIWKANSSILNTLLKAMDERRGFDNNGGTVQLPLISLFGASNEFPESEELNALYDRFAFKYLVKPLQDRDSRKAMLKNRSSWNTTNQTTLTLDELLTLQKEVQAVTIPEDMYDLFLDVWEKLQQEGFLPTDRKFKWTLNAIRANAFLNGRNNVTTDDLPVLQHLLWNREADIKVVSRVVNSFSDPFDQQGLEFLDEALICRDFAVDAGSSTEGIKANSQLKSILEGFKKLLNQASAAGKNTTKLKAYQNKIEEANRQILSKCLGLDS